MGALRKFDIGIDLGTSKFSIWTSSDGLVSTVPAYLAFRGRELTSASIVAVGEDARAMIGRVSSDAVQVVCPMKDGVIVNRHAAELIVKYMTRKIGRHWGLGRPSTLATLPLGASSLERKTFFDVARSLGNTRVVMMEEPLAAANSLDVDLSEPYAYLVLDIGEGVTEAIVVSMGKKVMGKSLRTGGVAIDQAIVDYIRTCYRMEISRDQARELKEALSGLAVSSSSFLSYSGIDQIRLIPTMRSIVAGELYALIDKVCEPIIVMIRDILNVLPPEFSVDLIENGIYLCGGGALTVGIREKLAEATGLDVHSADAPQNAVIKGIGRLMKYVEHLG